MDRWKRFAALLFACAAASLIIPRIAGQQDPLKKALLLLRMGDTAEARRELEILRRQRPGDPEILYQIARSHLMDFHKNDLPERRRVSLSLAMEMLDAVLKRNPDHIPALRAKAVIHARAELLYYDPNLSYRLAARVAQLEPHANAFLLNLSEWMSGEVRFTHESGHRVPHDPLLGLDRSIELLGQVIDSSMPFSNEETAGLFAMGNTLSKRGDFREAVSYFKQAMTREMNPEQRISTMREMGASYYRLGRYEDAARTFYEILQHRADPIDQWLLRVSLDQIKGELPPLPPEVFFPREEPKIDPANAPLLEFEDIAGRSGIRALNGNGTCAWGDIDGDGDQDLIVAGSGVFLRVYRNDKGKFTEVTEEVGLSKVPSGYSLNLVDYDNDGALDLYLALNGWSGPMPNMLFHNEGGKFVNVSKQSGLDDPGSGFVSLWGDLDNDGWLDVVVANGVLKDGSVTQIYRNNRDGTFTNVTRAAGLDEPPSFGAIGLALGDYDKDGRLDILINGLDPAPNRLYHNDGNWRFTNVAKKAGAAQAAHNAFVCFFFDYNNDGWPDILTTSLAPWDAVVEGLKRGYAPANPRAVHPDSSRLFRNNRDGTFTDVTFEAKLYHPMGTMGAGVADLDNDGYVDIYFGTGDPQMSRLEPNRFFRNNGEGTFADLTRSLHFARPGNKGHGVAFVDIDDDGDLDVFAQLGGHYPGDHAYNAFYRNLKGNRNNWLAVELEGTKSNRFGVGAQLTVTSEGLVVYREVKGSEGFGATNPYRQHFGLGQRKRIDTLEIRWPNGARQVLRNLPPNRIMKVREEVQP